MGEFGELIVIYDLLPEIVTQLDRAVDAAVRKAAFDIQRGAQQRAPVDTGFLKNSIYTVTENKSGYDQAYLKADSKNPEGEMLPEVAPAGKHEAYVAVGASYGVYVEFGSVHHSAQPYLTPAAEYEWPAFQAALAKIEAKLEVSGGIVSSGIDVTEE